MKKLVIFCIVFMGVACKVKELPSFFKTCKMNEPKLNECILEKAKLTLPGLLKGSKEFRVPSFLPFKLKEVKFDAGNVILTLSDFEMHGLDSAELIEVSADMAHGHDTGIVKISQLRINGTYDIDGKIMILPIKGHGPAYMVFDDVVVKMDYTFTTTEDPVEKQYHYMKANSIDIDYSLGNAFFIFENLFNGDKRLGDEMNKFLNENWQEFGKDLKPAITNVIKTVVFEFTTKILELVPLEKMFPK